VRCLSAGAQQQLERDLDVYVHYGMLVPGASQAHSRPGSAVLFLNDEPADGGPSCDSSHASVVSMHGPRDLTAVGDRPQVPAALRMRGMDVSVGEVRRRDRRRRNVLPRARRTWPPGGYCE
jgi:hypothetical protein